MYQLIRKVHAYACMVVLSFLLMYFVTGYLMVHPNVLPQDEAVIATETHVLVVPEDLEGEALSIFIQDRLKLGGKRFPPKAQADGSQKLTFLRPGARHDATVAQARDRVEVVTTHSTAKGVANGLHRMHKRGGGWKYDVWFVLYDIASVSLLVFVVTGTYMWYRRSRKRALGWTILAGSFAYAGSIVLYLAHAP